MIPVLIPKTYHKDTMIIGSKEFVYNDIKAGRVEPKILGLSPDWYGGRVEYFGKTVDGFLLCVENGTQSIIGCYVPTLDGLSKEALNLLVEHGVITEDDIPTVEEVEDSNPNIENTIDVEEVNVNDTVEEVDTEDVTNKINEKVNARIKARKGK